MQSIWIISNSDGWESSTVAIAVSKEAALAIATRYRETYGLGIPDSRWEATEDPMVWNFFMNPEEDTYSNRLRIHESTAFETVKEYEEDNEKRGKP